MIYIGRESIPPRPKPRDERCGGVATDPEQEHPTGLRPRRAHQGGSALREGRAAERIHHAEDSQGLFFPSMRPSSNPPKLVARGEPINEDPDFYAEVRAAMDWMVHEGELYSHDGRHFKMSDAS
jgi:hypothetical protein